MTTPTEARVYVGTYAKYNAGSIAGAWIDLEDHDAETFRAACLELHSDEADPELMFQDYEGFPRKYYSESSLDDALWEWLELSEEEQKLLALYLEHVNQDGSLDEARESFGGTYDSAEDWAREFHGESIPAHLEPYVDYARFVRDATHEGINFVKDDEGNTYVFYNR